MMNTILINYMLLNDSIEMATFEDAAFSLSGSKKGFYIFIRRFRHMYYALFMETVDNEYVYGMCTH